MTESRWLSPDEQLMWRSHRHFHQLLELAIDRQLQRSAGLSTADYSVLVSLSEAEEDGLRARDLGNALGWDRSRVSHQVRRMEQRGLVTKAACPDDGRGTLVRLTPEGDSTIRAAAPEHVEKVCELFIDQLSVEEVSQLTDIYLRIIARIGEVDGISLPGVGVGAEVDQALRAGGIEAAAG